MGGAAVAAIDGVELWEESDQALAALSGYQRDLGAIPYKDYAVVVATNLSPMTPTQSFVTEADLSCQAIQDGELVSSMVRTANSRPRCRTMNTVWTGA